MNCVQSIAEMKEMFKIGEEKLRNYFWIAILSLGFLWPGTVALADEGSYRIGPGDVLEISVWKDDSLDRESVAQQYGAVTRIGFLGDLQGDWTKDVLRNSLDKGPDLL